MKVFHAVFFTVMCTVVFAQDYRPPDGYVPDKETAVKIAEAVLTPIYSKKLIESEEPFEASLKGDMWTVTGTLRCPDGKGGLATTPQCRGGVAVVRISKLDARVISMEHGR